MIEMDKTFCAEMAAKTYKTGSNYPTKDEIKTVLLTVHNGVRTDNYMEVVGKYVISGTAFNKLDSRRIR